MHRRVGEHTRAAGWSKGPPALHMAYAMVLLLFHALPSLKGSAKGDVGVASQLKWHTGVAFRADEGWCVVG